MKVLNRKEILDLAVSASYEVAEVIGSTMTPLGQFVSLKSGITTNDGATIITDMEFYNPVKATVLSKIITAAKTTEAYAGDGTSATTLFTDALIRRVRDLSEEGISYLEIERQLNDFEDKLIEYISEKRKSKLDESDYIKLATISIKDEELGEVVGKALFASGEKSGLMVRYNKVNKKDEFTQDLGHKLYTETLGLGLPTHLKDVKIVLVNEPLIAPNNFINNIAKYVYDKNQNVMVICNEVGDQLVRFIKGLYTTNQDKDVFLTFATMPQGNQALTREDLVNDFCAYVDTQEYTSNVIKPNFEGMKWGFAKEIKVDQTGTTFITEQNGESETAIAQREILVKEYQEKINANDPQRLEVLRARIQNLTGAISYINLWSLNSIEYETKRLRVEDAVKAIKFTAHFGLVPGAGSIFRDAANAMYPNDENKFSVCANAVEEQVAKMAGVIVVKREVGHGIIIDAKDGYKVKYGNLIENGIVDSAMVAAHVVKNAVSIARDINKIHFLFVGEERRYDDAIKEVGKSLD